MSLPKCRLCGKEPDKAYIHGYAVCHGSCPMSHAPLRHHEWLALMSPPTVTDAMVERAYDAAWDPYYCTLGKDEIRAVLEAALNPKEAPDA